MNILHLTNGDDIYGSALALKELLTAELEGGEVTPYVVTPMHNGLNDFCDEKGIKNCSIRYEWSQVPKHNAMPVFVFKYMCHFAAYHVLNKKAEERLAEIIRREKIELVHFNNMVIDIGINTCRRMKIPMVFHLREMLKENYNCYPINKSFIRQLNNSGGSFIAISKAVKKNWISLGIDADKITTIYDGIVVGDYLRKENKPEAGGTDKKHHFVMVGSFCPAKRQKFLVDAVAKLPKEIRDKLQVDFYGRLSGEYYKELIDKIRKLGLEECFSMKGYSHRLGELLCNYECGIMCSENEAFGRVTVEYMAAGICPIAADGGAVRELIRNGENGLLFASNSVDELACKLQAVIDGKYHIAECGKKANEDARKHYDIAINLHRIIAHFLKM